VSRYIAALDDSGGIEPLLDWNGNFIEGAHPITSLSALIIKESARAEFDRKWNRLRLKIQRQLGCEVLPPIHLRIMYGRTLPKRYRGRDNPYLNADFENILGWIEDAYRLIWTFGRKTETLVWRTKSRTRRQLADMIVGVHENPQYKAELQFLKENSKSKRTKNMGLRYYKRTVSPLILIMLEMFLNISEIVSEVKGKVVNFIIDPFEDAHGVDTGEIIDVFRSTDGIDNIGTVTRADNADEVPLVQAADLIGFMMFRKSLFEFRGEELDPLLDNIYRKYEFSLPDLAKVDRRIERKFKHVMERFQVVRYLLAKQQIDKVAPKFSEKYMIDADEAYRRMKQARSDTNAKGILILKDQSVCSHLVKANPK